MSRTRLAAIVAALGIVLLSVFAGAGAAFAAPPAAPTIDSYPSVSMNPSEIITGTVTATGGGIDMVVMVYNTLIDPLNPVCTDTVPTLNLPGWGCDVPLADGYNTIYAVSYEVDFVADEFSPPSNSIVIARGGTQLPAITSPTNGETVADSTPVFSGTGPVLGSVIVNGGPFSPACPGPVPVDEFGNWSCEASTPMPPDLYGNFQANATRQDGSAGGFSEFVGVTIAPGEPTVTYSVAPASVTANAVGEPTGAVSVELYSVVDTGDGYDYTIVSGCPTLTDTLELGHERAYGGPSVSCPFTGLAPGIWNVYSGQRVDGIYSEYRNDFVRIPTTPSLAARLNRDRSVTISGSAQAGGVIHVQTTAGRDVCQAAVVGTSFSCTVTPSAGRHSYVAYAYDQGFAASPSEEPADSSFQGISAASSQVSVTVPLPPPPAEPAVVRLVTVALPAEAAPGDEIEIEGSDAPAGADLSIELHSDPVVLGSAVVADDGTFSKTVTIPEDTEPGEHHIVIFITPTDGTEPTEIEQPLTVVAPAAVEESDDAGTAPQSSHPATPHRSQPGAVSALGIGLVSPAEILGDPVALATAGSLGLALVLLVLVPAEFFGEALASHYGSMGSFFTRRQKLKRALERAAAWIESNRFLAGGALVLVTSVVFCFVDPGFGLDLTSLRLLLSCAASILLVNFLSAGITERVAEKAWKVPTRLEVMPWGLAIAIVGVVASRLLSFSPGFLIGSIIGVSVVGAVSKKLEMRVILLWSAVVWVVAMLAWALAPLVPTLPATHPASFFTALMSDSLTATAAAGLTALVVALLPIALFDGGELFKHSKLRWAIAFGIAVASFSIVVLPSASNWLGLGDGLVTWLLLTLAFIAIAVVVYLLALRRNGTRRSRLLKSPSQA